MFYIAHLGRLVGWCRQFCAHTENNFVF